jgi:spermidine synthase
MIVEPLNAHTAIAYRCTQVIASGRSALQQLEILDTPGFGRVLRLDGSGDGGALRQILDHQCVEAVSLVEMDAEVVEFSRRHLPATHRGAFDDPRASIQFTDGAQWRRDTAQSFDLLLLDLTDPVGQAHHLYALEVYALCRDRLFSGGVVGFHVQSPGTRPCGFAWIVRTLRSVFRWFVHISYTYRPIYGTWFGMVTASMDVDPLRETEEQLDERIATRNLRDLRFYNAATHRAGFALPNFLLELLKLDVPLVTRDGPRLDQHVEFRTFSNVLGRCGLARPLDLCNSDG